MDSKSKHSGSRFLKNCKNLLLRPLKKLQGVAASCVLSPLDQGGTDSNNADIQEPRPSSHVSLSDNVQRICKYDVFISFRGPDTRYNFTDHLYNQLIARGISTFIDDHELEKGQPISSQLLQAIKDSRVSIVVFSESYATSTWCLEEMATIVDCQRDLNQIVFPIFYNMDPSNVRNQNGVYEEAFASHTWKFKDDLGKVDRWKRAMVDLANLVGWHVRDTSEFNEIGKIVRKVIKALGHKFSRLVDDLVGIQPCVDELENLLKLRSKDDGIRVLGIWGMGGIGKTTLVKALYDKISYQFHACSFIDTSKAYKEGGVSAIHKQIFLQAQHEQNLDTFDSDEISGILDNMLVNRKVLVVLDNVYELGQLEKLPIGFPGTGSRIIITTRDEHILKVCGATDNYKVPLLNEKDANSLFRKKAFKGEYPKTEFEKLIPEVLKYTACLPLAITVVGSFLSTRNAIEWRDALDRLRSNPDNGIMDVLRISFDGLHPEEKETFLHIACFFKGERADYVKRILDGCGLHPYIGIPVIIEKSLISIINNEIHMHEMLQELGIKIVREKSPKDPGSWSRLWLSHDFRNVLKSKLGTGNTKAIVLDREMDVSVSDWLDAEELSKMKRLELLILYQRNFSGSLDFLSNELHWLSWQGYPFPSLPLKFESNKLVELNMSNSNIKQLWEGIKNFPSLKRMDLSNSKYLESTPNFEGSPNLERLDLTGCTSLSVVHPSIGFLTKLVFLSFLNCISLVTLVIITLPLLHSLRVLYLSGCTRLEKMLDLKNSRNLEYLDLERCTSLSHIHRSIWDLETLKFLSLRHCHNLVLSPILSRMKSLVTLDICNCRSMPPSQIFHGELLYSMRSLIFLDLGFYNLSQVPDAIGELRSLERLNLQGNNFRSLPDTVSQLSSLAYLNLSHCHELADLPLLPSIKASSAGRYFETVSGSRNYRSGLYFYDCPNLVQSQLQRQALAWLTRLIEQPRHFRCGFDIIIGTHDDDYDKSVIPEWFNHEFPGIHSINDDDDDESVIPKWFNHEFPGNHSMKTTMHSDVDDKWIGFSFCVAFKVHKKYYDFFRKTEFSCLSLPPPLPHPLYLSFESQHTEERFNTPLSFNQEKNVGSTYLWIIYISRPHCHFVKNGAHISFKARPGLEVMKWGLRVLFNEDVVTMRSNFGNESLLEMQKTGNQVHNFTFDYAQETERWSSCSDKIQLPYNWLVTEEEEMENIGAKQKENNLSIIGLSQPPLEDRPSSSSEDPSKASI